MVLAADVFDMLISKVVMLPAGDVFGKLISKVAMLLTADVFGKLNSKMVMLRAAGDRQAQRDGGGITCYFIQGHPLVCWKAWQPCGDLFPMSLPNVLDRWQPILSLFKALVISEFA